MKSASSIGRVRGLGSAHEGPDHWWHQRMTAGANLFLMLWLLASVAMLPGYDLESLTVWARSAWVAIPMLMLVASVFYHARLGLQVLIEDYVHDESRVVLLLLLNVAAVAGAAIALFAVLKLAFTGAPA